MGGRFLMKINIWLNNYYSKYGPVVLRPNQHIEVGLFNQVIDLTNEDDLIILRGEPTVHPFLWQLLNKLQGRNFILSTESSNPSSLINYKKDIPYISFRYDGYLNDQIRGSRPLSINMAKILQKFSGEETTLRIEYTISPYNLDFLDADTLLMRKMLDQYSKMKEPYFVIYQQSEIYNQTGYIWTPLSKEKIVELNKRSLLTKKTLQLFNAWINKADYSCTALRDEIVIDPEGKVRLCQSMRFNEIIGDLNTSSLTDIVDNSKEKRSQASECPMRKQCWLAYHYKENVSG